MYDATLLEPYSWDVERRTDGALVVRVHSSEPDGQPLPDAVFAFRTGDPQYFFWEQMLLERRAAAS
jgi:hypothetical protein